MSDRDGTFARGQSAVTVKGATRQERTPGGDLGGQITDRDARREYNPAAGSVTFGLGARRHDVHGRGINSSVSVNTDGTAISAAYTVTIAGTYRWVAAQRRPNNNDRSARGHPSKRCDRKATPSMRRPLPDVGIGGNGRTRRGLERTTRQAT